MSSVNPLRNMTYTTTTGEEIKLGDLTDEEFNIAHEAISRYDHQDSIGYELWKENLILGNPDMNPKLLKLLQDIQTRLGYRERRIRLFPPKTHFQDPLGRLGK